MVDRKRESTWLGKDVNDAVKNMLSVPISLLELKIFLNIKQEVY